MASNFGCKTDLLSALDRMDEVPWMEALDTGQLAMDTSDEPRIISKVHRKEKLDRSKSYWSRIESGWHWWRNRSIGIEHGWSLR